MAAHDSRYAGLEIAALRLPGAPGEEPRTVRYLRRRFVPPPPPPDGTRLPAHTVVQGERLDVLAASHLGDPTQFWRICDANGALRPDELVETPGRVLDIPLPGA